VVRRRATGLQEIYGDASDPEFVAHLPLGSILWVVSAIPPPTRGLTHEDHRVALLDALRERGFGGRVAAVAHGSGEAEALRSRGVDLVLMPYHDAAERAAELVAALPPAPG
jgi:hypothetical protein